MDAEVTQPDAATRGDLSFFATCPKGMEELLAGELGALGAGAARAQRAGVSFVGPLSLAYRACLWSRLASRVLLPLTSFAAGDPQQLYAAVRQVDWSSHLEPDGTLAVEVAAARPPKGLAHSHFVAQRVKDAVVDQFRERYGRRPSVDVHRPDVRLNLYQRGEAATLSIDLSGESLHRRGYRREGAQTEAPLKENLAAAILTRAGWAEMVAAGAAETPADVGTAAEVATLAEAGAAALAGIPALVDPLCGSGTLLIEGAWMAADVAPGLLRAAEGRFGFIGWKRHDRELWEGLVAEARERRAAGLARLRAARAQAGGRQLCIGYDRDPRAVGLAQECVKRAGLGGVVEVVRRELSALAPPAPAARSGHRPGAGHDTAAGAPLPPGLIVTNPPYGERLEATAAEVVVLYTTLGERLRAGFPGWRAAVLVGDRSLGHLLGMRAARLNTLYNGALKVTLLQFEVPEAGRVPLHERSGKERRAESEYRAAVASPRPDDRGATGRAAPAARDIGSRTAAVDIDDFANRLHKNARHLGRTMRRQGITCYRVYDADLPDYAFAIDLYEEAEDWHAGTTGVDEGARDEGRTRPIGGMQSAGDRSPRVHAHVQEYAAPATIDPARAQARLRAALRAIPDVLQLDPRDVHLKVRRAQRGSAQYERQGVKGRFLEVREGDLRFLVNLTDYLDTGLFLDGRLTRALIRDTAQGARVLNLFAYTGAAAVAAGRGGAATTTSVDLSRTYLDWARRNLELNKLKPSRNHLVQADALEWIGRPHDGSPDAPEQYDLVFLDPPTFSNSKRMGRATFDVARDHGDLIRVVARRLLCPGGTLLFATNARRFRMEVEALTSSGLDLHDLSAATLPPDFSRSARMHHLWRIRSGD